MKNRILVVAGIVAGALSLLAGGGLLEGEQAGRGWVIDPTNIELSAPAGVEIPGRWWN